MSAVVKLAEVDAPPPYSDQTALPAIQFTAFGSNRLLTKTISVQDGVLVKEASGHNPTKAARVSVKSLQELDRVMDTMSPSAALGWGTYLSTKPEVRVVVKGKEEDGVDVISRTASNFGWPQGPGILMCDIDEPHTPEESRSLIVEAAAAAGLGDWQEVEMLYRPSSSAGCYIDGADPETALTGGRFYLVLDSAADIPTVGQRLVQGLWFIGNGKVIPSAAGSPLFRCLLDASVWQPHRLDFIAPAVLGDGISRAPVDSVFFGTPFVSVPKLPPESDPKAAALLLANEDKYKDLLKRAEQAAERELSEARAKYIDERCRLFEEASIASGLRGDELQTAIRGERARYVSAVDLAVLNPGFKLWAGDTQISVADLLSDPAKWDRTKLHDPLEPDKGKDKAIFYARPKPLIFSFLHGGRKFRLDRGGKVTIPEPEGGSLEKYVKSVYIGMGTACPDEFFLYGDELVQVQDAAGKFIRMSFDVLPLVLSKNMQFEYRSRGELYVSDLMVRHAKNLLSAARMGPEWAPLSPLLCVSALPLWNPHTNTILSSPGYDAKSKYYVTLNDEWPEAKAVRHLPQARSLADSLFAPYMDFNVCRPQEPEADAAYTKAVILSCVLERAIRRTVLGPIISISAERAGDGKTYLQKCFIAEAGVRATTTAYSKDAEEAHKRLVAASKSDNDYIAIDNHDGLFGGAELEALTSKEPDEKHSMRLLGTTDELSVFNDRFICVNGIGIRPRGEAVARRMLDIRLTSGRGTDSGAAWAGKKMRFGHDPAEYILANYKQRRMDALSLVAWGAAQPEMDTPINSMRGWSKLVRGTVFHLTGIDVGATLLETATDVAAEGDRCSPRGRILHAAYKMVKESETRPAANDAGHMIVMPGVSSIVKSPEQMKRTVFTVKSLREYISAENLDPDKSLRHLLEMQSRILLGAALNGINVIKVPKDTGLPKENKVAYYSVTGEPAEEEE